MSGKNPIPTRDPQVYEGANVLVPVGGWQFVKAKRDPTSNDKKFPVGTLWVNTVSQNVWIQTQPAGVWTELAASSGNVDSITGTANEITASSATGAVTLSVPSTFIAPGSIASTTSLTATLGNITATNGNLVLGTAGNKLSIATGSNASCGVTGVMTLGVVSVASTACTTSSVILYSRATTGGTPGNVSITAQSSSGFTLTSTSTTETSTFNWLIIN